MSGGRLESVGIGCHALAIEAGDAEDAWDGHDGGEKATAEEGLTDPEDFRGEEAADRVGQGLPEADEDVLLKAARISGTADTSRPRRSSPR